jgi:acetyl-CoA carboxylase carboxyltransferase component
MREEIERLKKIEKEVEEWPQKKGRIERYRKKRKYTARERINLLLDPDSFNEVAALTGSLTGLPAEGIIAGFGTISGRPVCCFASDSMVQGGSIGQLHGLKIYETVERALQMQVPCIGLWDAGGGRILKLDEIESGGNDICMEGNERGGHCSYYPVTQASGIIPQISVTMGSCAGNAVYTQALTDFVFMVDKTSHMFVTGPKIVKSAMAQDTEMEELGGAEVHARITGLCDFRGTEDECLENVRTLLSFLPLNCDELPPVTEPKSPKIDTEILDDILPVDTRFAYDIYKIIQAIVDGSEFFEIKREFAPEMINGFARLNGQPVGIIANNIKVKAGGLTADGSRKESRFIRFCDCFNIPLVLLVDTPAYFPGKDAEHSGIIPHGSKVVHAFCEATVPRILVLLRKVYGGGTIGMAFSPGLGTDFVFAWPTAQVAMMGASQSVDMFYDKEISSAQDPAALKRELVKKYEERYNNPFVMASETTHIDAVIQPRDTRKHLVEALRLMKNKKLLRYNHLKKHGNIPL